LWATVWKGNVPSFAARSNSLSPMVFPTKRYKLFTRCFSSQWLFMLVCTHVFLCIISTSMACWENALTQCTTHFIYMSFITN
jgi:hypothetical protein